MLALDRAGNRSQRCVLKNPTMTDDLPNTGSTTPDAPKESNELLEQVFGSWLIRLPRLVGIQVEIEQAQPVLARGEIADLLINKLLLNMLGAIDVPDNVVERAELLTFSVIERLFAGFVSLIKLPGFLSNRVKRIFQADAGVKQVNKRLKGSEGLLSQKRRRIFRFLFSFAARFDRSRTTIFMS